MRKATYLLRRHCRSHWGPLAGLLTGLVFVAAQWTSPHVGDGCTRLGQIDEEWRFGQPSRQIMCIANTDGELVYDRFILPHKRANQVTALN